MPPRLTTALLARPLAAAGVSALAVFGALPAAADPSDGASPAQTDDVFRPSTAIFQPSKCVAGKQNVGVTLTNGSGASQTFLITSQGGTVSPASTTVPANQSTTLTLHASGARQSIFVSTKGKSAGSMPLPGCTTPSSSSSSSSRSTSDRATGGSGSADSTTSASAGSTGSTGQAQTSPSDASSGAGSTASTTGSSSAAGSDSSSDAASGSTSSSSSAGSSPSSTSGAASAAMPSQAAGSSTSNGPSPLMVTGGIVLAALGLTIGGVALFREFRK